MLQFIRTYAGSWIVKILFVFLILSFGVWGIGDVIRGRGQSSTVVTVGPVEIGRSELDQEFRRQMERLRPLFGGNLTAEQARQLGLVDQAVNVLVQRTLYDLAAKDAGLSVGVDTVRQRIADEPAFRNDAGQFDANRFRAVLRNNNLTEDGYIAVLRQEIGRSLVAGAVVAGATAPKPLVDALFRHQEEKRVAEVVTLPNTGDVGTPDDAVVKAYYDANIDRYTAPEFRAVSVLPLTIEAAGRDVEVTDAEIRAAYDERSGEFGTPERRTIRFVLVDDEAKAKQIADSAAATALDDAAKAAGEEVRSLDNVTKAEVLDLGDAAFALDKGKASAPVKTAFGWYVLQVTDIVPGATKSLDEVRARLIADIRREKGADRLYKIETQVDDALASGASLDEVAKGQGVALVTIPAITADGKTPDGAAVTGVPAVAEVARTAFSLEAGKTSGVIETKEGAFIVVHVTSVTPAAPRPLDSVRADVVAAWTAAQQAKKTAEAAQALAEKLKTGGDAGELARAAGGSIALTAPFTRDTTSVEGVPAEMVGKLFAANPGEVVTGATATAQVVARLKEVIPADPAAPGADTATLATQVSRGIENDLAAQFAEALRQRYPVTVERQRIAQMFAAP